MVTKSRRSLPYVTCSVFCSTLCSKFVPRWHYETAQVASQEGKYLGRKLSKLAKQEPILKQNQISVTDEAVSCPFEYKHLGTLAYIGNAAVFDLGQNYTLMGGLVRSQGIYAALIIDHLHYASQLAMYAWRSVYWSEQVSARTRALLMFDWIIR